MKNSFVIFLAVTGLAATGPVGNPVKRAGGINIVKPPSSAPDEQNTPPPNPTAAKVQGGEKLPTDTVQNFCKNTANVKDAVSEQSCIQIFTGPSCNFQLTTVINKENRGCAIKELRAESDRRKAEKQKASKPDAGTDQAGKKSPVITV